MSFWISAALLCAALTFVIIRPLAKEVTTRRLAVMMMIVLPLLALGLYLYLGNAAFTGL